MSLCSAAAAAAQVPRVGLRVEKSSSTPEEQSHLPAEADILATPHCFVPKKGLYCFAVTSLLNSLMYPPMASAIGNYPGTERRPRHKELAPHATRLPGRNKLWRERYLLLHVEYDLGTRHDNTLHLSYLTSVGTRLQRRWGTLKNTLQVRCMIESL